MCAREGSCLNYGRTISHVVARRIATAGIGSFVLVRAEIEASWAVKLSQALEYCLVGQADAGGVQAGPVNSKVRIFRTGQRFFATYPGESGASRG